jgi:hypothetical protein
MTVFSANIRPFVVNPATIVLFREVFALVIHVDVPVTVLYEYRDIFMAQIPSYIVKVFLVFRCFNRQRKVPAAQPGTFKTLNLFCHSSKLLYSNNNKLSAQNATL